MNSKLKQIFHSERFHSFFEWFVTLSLAVLFSLFISRFVILNAHVPSASMEKTMMIGDKLIASRLSFLFSSPKRFDIVVFKFPLDTKKLYVKRVIGLPGEKLQIIHGKVYINDSKSPLRDDFANGTPVGDFGPFFIPKDNYFVLGDNRNDSCDSKDWGFVPKDNLVAKPIFRYYPHFTFYN